MERNGIDLDVRRAARDSVREDPEEGRVVLRSRHRWSGGFSVEGRAEEIEAGGEVVRRSFTFRTDWPEDVGGRDGAPTPGEALLGALGGCVGLSYVAGALQQGIEIESLEIVIEARADLAAVFGAGGARPGLSAVQVRIEVPADADVQALEALGDAAAPDLHRVRLPRPPRSHERRGTTR